MKKNHFHDYFIPAYRHKKLLLIMKLTIILNFFCLAAFSLNTLSQSQGISLSLENVKVKDVFRIIEDQSSYRFFYNDELSDVNRIVNINAENSSIDEILNNIFSNTDISCTILENNLVIVAPKRAVQQKVSGRVTDATTGEPLPGVNVTVKGTTIGTFTDMNGFFSLDKPQDNAIILFSFVGYLSEEIVFTGQSTIDVSLVVDLTELEEVIVIGYGTQKKEEVTTAITKIKSEDFVQGSVKSPLQLLQGKVPGLGISNVSGDPTAGVELMIRGVTTLTAANQNPLFVIDGIPGGSIYTIAPEDIESVDVMKDGSAAAIYGTQGSNGVIFITTKKSKNRKGLAVELNSSISLEKITKSRDILTADDYIRYKTDSTQLPGSLRTYASYFTSLDFGHKTNWVDEITRQAFGQVHSLSVSGGNETSNFISSVTYRTQEGTMLNSDRESYAVRFSANQSALNNRVKFNFNINNNNFTDHFIYTYAYHTALIMNPTLPVYNEDGSYFEHGTTLMPYNPVAILKEETDEKKWVQTLYSGRIIIEPVKGLNITALGAIQRYNENRDKWSTFNHYNTTVSNLNGAIWKWSALNIDYTAEYTINYSKNIGNHNFNILGGYSYQMFTYRGSYIYAYDLATEAFDAWELLQAYSTQDGKSDLDAWRSESKLISFFGRLTYNFKEKYLFMASLRNDGCSKFGDNSKWGIFPAVSAGWRVNEEPFLRDVAVINELKLRAGYGVTGVTPSASYASLPLLTFSDSKSSIYDGKIIKGVVPSQNYNPDLHWEEKHEFNVGADFALFNKHISGSIDFFNRTTKDLLWYYTVPTPPNMVSTTLANGATIENKGFEAIINATPLQKSKFKIEVSANISYSKNKIVSLSSGVYSASEVWAGWTGSPIQQSTHKLWVGDEVGNFYGWQVDSLSTNGIWYYKTDSMGSVNNPAIGDKRKLGNGIPKIFAGLNTTITYKGFDLYVGLRGAFKFQVYNQYRSHYENLSVLSTRNVPRSALEPQMNGHIVRNAPAYNSHYIEQGDFVKIDNISLGYTFNNLDNLYISSFRIYVSVLNLHTFTKYSGLDPEVSFKGLYPGIEYYDTYPKTTTYTMGIHLVF
jgi:TonB-linked SusC/RagA family outer membrane protein